MSKSVAVTLFLMCLLTSTAVYQQTVTAQFQGDITINADGNISPASAPILQNGNIYTLTSDIRGTIRIAKSNTTFNGNKYTVDQYAETQDQGNAYGIFLGHVYNVTVANTTITNTGNGVYAIQQPTAAIYIDYGGSNVIIGNNVVNNFNAMSFLESNNNIVTKNNFTNNNNPYVIVSAVMFWGSSNNTIYHNNFIDNKSPAGTASFNSQSSGNTWDNGKEGNFWDDYNGTDANGDGIGDTPYIINRNNKDNNPLMKQVLISNSLNPVPSNGISPTPSPEPTPIPQPPEPFPTTIVVYSVAIAVAVAGIVLLVYTLRNAKKRGMKHE